MKKKSKGAGSRNAKDDDGDLNSIFTSKDHFPFSKEPKTKKAEEQSRESKDGENDGTEN